MAAVATPFSACLWVNDDQAAALLRTLESLKNAAAEVVIGLGPEASESVERIALAYATQVLRPEGDASARMRALVAACAGEWVLLVDSGELWSGALPAGLGGEAFGVEVVVTEGERAKSRFQSTRLVRRAAELRFRGAIEATLDAPEAPVLEGARLNQPVPDATEETPESRRRRDEVHLAEIERVGADTGEGLFHLGLARMRARDVDAAVSCFARARKAGLDEPSARLTSYLLEARGLVAGEREQEARQVLEAGLSKFAHFPEFHFELGSLLRQSGALEPARAHFEACLAASGTRFPSAVREGVTGHLARLQLAAVCWQLGDRDAARRQLDAAAAEVEGGDRARVTEFGAFLEALALRRAEETASPGIEAVTAALAGKETVDEIVGVLVLYTEQFPRCDAGFQMLGQTLMSLGRDAEAAEALIKSLSLNSSDAMTYQTLSMVLMPLGHLEWADACQAVADFLDGLAEFPELPPTDGSPFTLALDRTLRLARPTISVCMIVKNEEENLPACLGSIQGHVDELIVVDTGSTDRTVEIAESFGAKLGYFAWRSDFSAAFNHSVEMATSDWVLVIHADERLVIQDPAAFRHALHFRKFGAYLIDQINRYDSGTIEYNPLTRFFQRHEAIRYEGHMHEHIENSLRRLKWPVEKLDALHLEHDGYMKEMAEKADKAGRNLSLALKGVVTVPTNVRNWAMLGVAAVSSKDFPLALQAFGTMMDLEMEARTGAVESHDTAMTMYLGVLFEQGRRQEAREVLEKFLSIALPEARLYRVRGQLRLEAGESLGATLDFLASDLVEAKRPTPAPVAV